MPTLIARYKPGTNVPAFAKTAVVGGRFVKIVDNRTAQGDYQVGHATAGSHAFGVAEYDSEAATAPAKSVGRRINVARRGSVANVTCGAAITAGDPVMSDANGKAVAHTGTNVLLGVACSTTTAADQVVEVDLV